MRIIGVLLAGLSIALYGFLITYRIIQSQKQLKSIVVMMNTVLQYIEYQKSTIGDIIDTLSKDKNYDFLFKNSNKFEDICLNNRNLYIPQEAKETLLYYFCGLGKSDVQGQISHSKLYLKIFKDLIKNSVEDDRKKIKLYPSLSVLTGMLVVLVLF